MSQRSAELEARYGRAEKPLPKPAMEPNAFRGEIIARTGLLVGGVKVHQSHPFVEWKDCVKWCDTIIETNLEAGRDPRYNGIRMVYCDNPIRYEEIANGEVLHF